MRIYTDGSRLGTGHGGWAWWAEDGRHDVGSELDTTNQRMELRAALEAVREHADDEPVTIVSDSAYVVNCFLNHWWKGWLERDWISSSRKPVANRDLWEPLVMAWQCHPDLTFEKVRGHSGDPGNEKADRLATDAAARAVLAGR